MSAAFSPIMITGAFVLPATIIDTKDASTIRKGAVTLRCSRRNSVEVRTFSESGRVLREFSEAMPRGKAFAELLAIELSAQ